MQVEADIADEIVIWVLLTLLHHPEAKAAQVVRYLRGHSPPIPMEQVDAPGNPVRRTLSPGQALVEIASVGAYGVAVTGER